MTVAGLLLGDLVPEAAGTPAASLRVSSITSARARTRVLSPASGTDSFTRPSSAAFCPPSISPVRM